MNKERRKEIDKAITLFQQIEPLLNEVRSIIEPAAEGEREYYDNMHENLQSGDKGSQADNAATQLEEVQSALDDLDISDLVSKLEDAKQ